VVFLFGKIAFAEMTVSENVGYRFIFGSLGLTPILWNRPPRFGRDAWSLLVVASIVGVPIQFLLQFKGLEATTVSQASLIVGTLPVLLALSSAALLKDKLNALSCAREIAASLTWMMLSEVSQRTYASS
jgi:drug/metabolite transporter (DMT)-like permease